MYKKKKCHTHTHTHTHTRACSISHNSGTQATGRDVELSFFLVRFPFFFFLFFSGTRATGGDVEPERAKRVKELVKKWRENDGDLMQVAQDKKEKK